MSAMPSICLVDTNVVIAANGPDLLSDEQYCCITPCIEMLNHIKSGNCKLVLDDGYEIINEYQHKLNPKYQKGVGDAFLKWVFSNLRNAKVIDLVHITSDADSYREFPRHADLHGFDPSDRKFIATANAHEEKPPVVQATDSKWWGWKEALEAVGLSVHFVNENYVRETYNKKMKLK